MVLVLHKERTGSESWSERMETCEMSWSSQRLVFTGQDKRVESVLALRGVYPSHSVIVEILDAPSGNN